MQKNPANQPKQNKKDNAINSTLKLFLAGCAAEAYVLVIRRFYINGTVRQVIAWDDRLRYVLDAGLVLAAAGLILGLALHRTSGWIRSSGWWLLGAGVFLAGSAWVSRTVYATGVTMMCVAIPILLVLGILWLLYERECAVTLTILGVSALAVWVCRHGVGNLFWNTYVMIGAAVYVVLLALTALAARKADRSGGKLGGFRFLPGDADTLPIYVACGISAAAVLVALISPVVAYYTLWTLAVIIFALAVYYTVRQL